MSASLLWLTGVKKGGSRWDVFPQHHSNSSRQQDGSLLVHRFPVVCEIKQKCPEHNTKLTSKYTNANKVILGGGHSRFKRGSGPVVLLRRVPERLAAAQLAARVQLWCRRRGCDVGLSPTSSALNRWRRALASGAPHGLFVSCLGHHGRFLFFPHPCLVACGFGRGTLY